MTERRGRRDKHLLDDLKEDRGYCKFEEEGLDFIAGRNGFFKRLWTCRKTDKTLKRT